MDWQPIETAPRDGTIVLAYQRDDIFPARFVSSADMVGAEDTTRRWWSTQGQQQAPTHWMHLPDPPA